MPLHPGFAAAALMAFVTGPALAADPSPPPWQALGKETYANICAACHQPTGLGLPDTFPPLAGHATEVLASPGGRDYMIRLVLFGLEGEITVHGKRFSSAMPPLAEALDDAQLAAALNHAVYSWDNDKTQPPGFAPFQASEIAAARASPMTGVDVFALREKTMPPPAATASAATPVSFTAEQADRGRTAYRRGCQDCHGFNLNDGEFGGAPLNGGYFARHWGNGNAAAIYGYLTAKMPPDRPGKLNPQTYADLEAFLLSKNGYESGATELPPDLNALQNMSLKK